MDHNHDKNERRTEMQQLRISVKRKADDDLTSRPSKLIRSELHKLDDNSKLEEQEKIIKPDGSSFVMTNSSFLLVRVSISSIALCTSSRDFGKRSEFYVMPCSDDNNHTSHYGSQPRQQ
jgi:hypothetical protein